MAAPSIADDDLSGPAGPSGRGPLAVATPGLPATPRAGPRADGGGRRRRGRAHDLDPAGDQGDHRRPDRGSRPRRAAAAGAAGPRAGGARGVLDLGAPLGAVHRGARPRDRDPARPLRAAPGAADELPRPLGVRPAALACHPGPVLDPSVRRLLAALPGPQHPSGHRGDRRAAAPLLAARAGGRRDRAAGDLALDALREGLRRGLAARPGRAGRPRHPRGGGRGRHPGDQVLRPLRARLAAVRGRGPHPLRHLDGQGATVGEVLELPGGHPSAWSSGPCTPSWPAGPP